MCDRDSIKGGGLGVRDPIGGGLSVGDSIEGGGLGVQDPIGGGLGVGNVIRGRTV